MVNMTEFDMPNFDDDDDTFDLSIDVKPLLCPKCGSKRIYEMNKDIVYDCFYCHNRIVYCPLCRKSLTENEGEYLCCNQDFAICPKCESIAFPYGSENGERRYKCTNKNPPDSKLKCNYVGIQYVFKAILTYRKIQRKKAEIETKRLKEINPNLTIREIANEVKFPISTVGKWLKELNETYYTNTIDRINWLIENKIIYCCENANDVIYNDCISSSHEDICANCDNEQIKKKGMYCFCSLQCPGH